VVAAGEGNEPFKKSLGGRLEPVLMDTVCQGRLALVIRENGKRCRIPVRDE